jgi:hypothetical protein
MRKAIAVSSTLAAFWAVVALLVACGPTRAERVEELSDPFKNPDFLTPVAEAQDAEVTLYWMGKEFQAGGLRFELSPVAYPIDEIGPGLGLDYAGDVGEGFVLTRLDMLAEAGGGPQEMGRRASAVGAGAPQPVQVAAWQGQLYVLPGGTSRPTNQLWLFVDLGQTTAIAQAFSGSTGVGGTDVNTLIDKDLLIQVVADNLRPYPE